MTAETRLPAEDLVQETALQAQLGTNFKAWYLRILTNCFLMRQRSLLPEEFRVVTTLYFLEDLPCKGIAETLELPVGIVRSRLHRGRWMLQKALWPVAVAEGIVPGGGKQA